jgi:hypothetical protein
MNNYILIWLISGLVGMNILWAIRSKHPVKNIIKGFVFGLLMGPIITVFIADAIKERNE